MNADTITSYKFAINILSDIVVGMCEHEKKLNLMLAANYIDHYRAFLELCTDGTGWEKSVIDFESFICDQSLLNSAASYIAREANETIVPLEAL